MSCAVAVRLFDIPAIICPDCIRGARRERMAVRSFVKCDPAQLVYG